jgi:Domain of unknown function (DUF5050)
MRRTHGFLFLALGSLASLGVGACRGEVALGTDGQTTANSSAPPGSDAGEASASSSGGSSGGSSGAESSSSGSSSGVSSSGVSSSGASSSGASSSSGATGPTGTCTTIPAGGGTPGAPILLGTVTSPNSVSGLAVDATNVYVASYEIGDVYAIPLAGGTPVVLDGIGSTNVAINSTSVFTVYAQGPDSPEGVVAGCAKTGCNGQYTTIASGQLGVWGIAADEESVYWTNAGATASSTGVFKAPVGGGAATLLSPSLAGAIVVSGGRAFYTGSTGGTDAGVLSVGVDGGAETVLVAGSADQSVVSITADCASVYYQTTNGTVAMVPVGGGTATVLLPGSGTYYGLQVASDASRVYYLAQNAVMAVPIGGGAAVTIASEQVLNPAGIAVDADYVYWSNRGNGTVMKVAK